MPSLLAIRLVSFEIVHCCPHDVARFLVRAYSVHSVPYHEQRLKGYHYFIVLHIITDHHQDFLGSHFSPSFCEICWFLLNSGIMWAPQIISPSARLYKCKSWLLRGPPVRRGRGFVIVRAVPRERAMTPLTSFHERCHCEGVRDVASRIFAEQGLSQ